MMNKRIMIAGPTASGKTALSVELAKRLNAEVISVDSRQCYKYLDIGTAKATAQEQQQIPHHNISVLEPDEEDSAADFLQRTKKYEQEIQSRKKQVIYCGGSTLHLQSIIQPLDDIPPSDKENLEKLNLEADEKGLEVLYERLQKTDPVYAEKMDGMNRQRIIRALDVWMQTGKPFSSFHENRPLHPPSDLAVFVLHHPRKKLHQRISERTDNMLEVGFLDEVKELLRMGYGPENQSLQTVGYRQAFEYLDGKCSYDKMAEDIKTATRRYAKRQITWFRRWPFANWFNMDDVLAKHAAGEIEARLSNTD